VAKLRLMDYFNENEVLSGIYIS